jgi:DNA-directed RNA polymerase alpha subunit
MDAVEKAPKFEKKATKTVVNKIEDLKFSKRTLNALLANKIMTVKNLQKLSEEERQKIKGLGAKGLTEVNKKLKKLPLN